MTHLRSLVFNVLFYLVSTAITLAAFPVFAFGSPRARLVLIRTWARIGLALLDAVTRTRFEIRGAENLPEGGVIIAAKHQSMFETFALFTVLDCPAVVMKHELARIPLWGWYATRAGMITIQREGGTSALRKLAASVRSATARGQEVIIFPEGTRRIPGAGPSYKGGISHLYRVAGVPVVPAATNSGLFWPRRKILRHRGTIVIEFLPPILPGLSGGEFRDRLQASIETASDALLAEAAMAPFPPPLPPEAAARLEKLRG